jgi:23S rRNA (cytosine1962-C5)-methyltransferase
VDHFGDWLSLQVQSAGMELLLPRLQTALMTLSGVKVLFERSEGAPRKQEGLPPRRGFLSGTCSFPQQIEEDGLRFLVDPGDQKTGFYLDQAPNRVRLKSMVQGKRVLDLCCFSGGFSLAALAAGAECVWAVDSSAQALQRLEENRGLNALPDRVRCIRSDVFEFLAQPAEPFDFVILDPPPFARAVADREAALKAYRRLNRLVAPWVAEGGRLMTFSCSGTIEEAAFAQSVFLSMRDAGREAQRLASLGPGPDHPVNLRFPEGAYLKGLDLVCYS